MIWLVGSKGMLGSEFQKLLQNSSFSFVSSDIDVDITKKQEIDKFLTDKEINYIVNCVAYTNVDLAEEEKEKAFLLNSVAVENLVKVAKEKNACLVHFSTDYVFNGLKSGVYAENDNPNPVSVYGKSKLAGENAILKGAIPFYIFRISWLYGRFGKCFPKTMINLFKTKKEISVVSDQEGSPTNAKILAENILKIIKKDNENYGIYHYSDLNFTNWYLFSKKTMKFAYRYNLIDNLINIKAVSSSEFKTKAKRPLNSKLSKEKFLKTFNLKLNSWEENLEKFIGELQNEKN